MKEKTFVTIFPRLKNIDLLKPPGMIPYYISKITGGRIKCRIITLNNDDYFYYEDFKGFYDLVILGDEKHSVHIYRTILKYIFKNAGVMDFLNLYHLNLESLIFSLFYKLLNKNGKIFLQLDADERIKDFFEPAARTGFLKITNNFRPLKSLILKGLVKRADYIAAETDRIFQYLMNKGNGLLKQKLFVNPYALNTDEYDKYYDSDIKKENIILTIGKIGDYQKNNEMLFDAVTDIGDLRGWKVFFTGPVTDNFRQYVTDNLKDKPDLKENILLTGEINNRKKLFELIQRAKIFCLTSRYESWGLVLMEAAYFNCFIISTDVGCADYIINRISPGKIIKDKYELKDILCSFISGNPDINAKLSERTKVPGGLYSWSETVNKLIKKLELV